ncbi:MAG TPA: alpha/beta fold hydrolase [Acidimicrobiales bacterium]|nr:alpha/beta fold hydrolase [Acidimicrobiales bacterium]
MPSAPRPTDLLARVRRDVERNLLRTRNGARLAAGLDRPATGVTPKEVVWRQGRSELWHYTAGTPTLSPPLLIIFSLVSRSYILDLTPGNSFVERLLEAGFDVWMLDWGIPDERDAGNTLDDYADGYIPAAIEQVRARTGAHEVSLLGYCFGGDLSLLHAAHHLDSPLRSLTVMATPVEFRSMGPMATMFLDGGLDPDSVVGDDGNVAASVIQQGFRAVSPTADVTRYVTLWEKLWDDDYVAAYSAMTSWSQNHIPFPGAAFRQTIDMLVRDDGMINDRLWVGGDRVHLADIEVPFLSVVAERDTIVPLEAAAPLIDLVGSEDRQELRLPGGHIGIVVGKTAARTTIPKLIEFLRQRSDAAGVAR